MREAFGNSRGGLHPRAKVVTIGPATTIPALGVAAYNPFENRSRGCRWPAFMGHDSRDGWGPYVPSGVALDSAFGPGDTRGQSVGKLLQEDAYWYGHDLPYEEGAAGSVSAAIEVGGLLRMSSPFRVRRSECVVPLRFTPKGGRGSE